MTEIKYIVGDATNPIGDDLKVIVHCCNNVGAFGAGFVLALSKKWKQPEEEYRTWSKDKETFKLGEVQFVLVEENIFVANMIGQVMGYSNGKPPIRYEAIREGLKRVKEFCIQYNVSFHSPIFGAGLAGGDFSIIEQIIIDEICTYDIPVTVYKFEDTTSISYVGTSNL